MGEVGPPDRRAWGPDRRAWVPDGRAREPDELLGELRRRLEGLGANHPSAPDRVRSRGRAAEAAGPMAAGTDAMGGDAGHGDAGDWHAGHGDAGDWHAGDWHAGDWTAASGAAGRGWPLGGPGAPTGPGRDSPGWGWQPAGERAGLAGTPPPDGPYRPWFLAGEAGLPWFARRAEQPPA